MKQRSIPSLSPCHVMYYIIFPGHHTDPSIDRPILPHLSMTQAREGRPKNTGCPKKRKSAQNHRDTMSPFLFPPFYTRTYEQIVFAWYNGAPAQAASRSNPVFWAAPIHHWPAASSSSSSPASDAHKKRKRERNNLPPFSCGSFPFLLLPFLFWVAVGRGRGGILGQLLLRGWISLLFCFCAGVDQQASVGGEGRNALLDWRKTSVPKSIPGILERLLPKRSINGDVQFWGAGGA